MGQGETGILFVDPAGAALAAIRAGDHPHCEQRDVLVILMGFFLPPVAIVLMITPIIMPGLLAHHFDPIWFGVNMSLVMETGLIHPPVGLNLFVIQGIASDIGLKDLMLAVLPFLLIIVSFIVVFSAFPEIALWLPRLFFRS